MTLSLRADIEQNLIPALEKEAGPMPHSTADTAEKWFIERAWSQAKERMVNKYD